jgi:hypothetical protein
MIERRRSTGKSPDSPAASMTMPNRLTNLLLAASLLLTSACYSSYFYSENPYSQLVNDQVMLEMSSELASAWSIASNVHSGYSDEDGYHNTRSLTAEFECATADLAAYAEDLKALFEEDIFGSGFHLLADESSLEAHASSGGLGPRAEIGLAWESSSSLGKLHIVISTGARSGLFDLHLEYDETGL